MLGNTGLMDNWQILCKSIEKRKKNKYQNLFVALLISATKVPLGAAGALPEHLFSC